MKTATIILTILILVASSCSNKTDSQSQIKKLHFEHYDNGYISMEIPKNWNMTVAGNGSTLAFLLTDPKNTARQIFMFGQVGPFYLYEQQRQIDRQYFSMAGGQPFPWLDTPAINPLNPQNFLKNFYLMAQTQMARSFMPNCPRLEYFQTISSNPLPTKISGLQRSLVRGVFLKNGIVAEGLFDVSVGIFSANTNGPGGNTGIAMLFYGITAPKDEFPVIKNSMEKSLASFTLSQQYVSQCMTQQNDKWNIIAEMQKASQDTADIIYESWENRNKSDDIIAEKRSDAILEKDRVYDPDTGEVYEVDLHFYDNYKLNRRKYRMKNLQLLPENEYELWMKAPLIGNRYIE